MPNRNQPDQEEAAAASWTHGCCDGLLLCSLSVNVLDGLLVELRVNPALGRGDYVVRRGPTLPAPCSETQTTLKNSSVNEIFSFEFSRFVCFL